MDPTVIGLGSFFALALGFITLRGDDDDDDEGGEPTLGDDGTTLDGTEGDDTIAIDDWTADHPDLETVNGGVGDDSLIGTAPVVNGGDGDDTLVANHSDGAEFNGDDGDDLITISDAFETTVSGGSGNDTINFTAEDGTGSVIFGGVGEDVITVSTDVHSYVFPSYGCPTVMLDEGADTVNLLPSDISFDADQGDAYISYIVNFDATEDVLNVQLGDYQGVYDGYRLVEGDTGTDVVLDFLVPVLDSGGAVTGSTVASATVRLDNTFDVVADAINITLSQPV